MSVACVSWLPVTSLPPMSTNQMWLPWLTGLSSSRWQLTLLCVDKDVGKMPPESCLSPFLRSFNLLFTFCIVCLAFPLCPSVRSHFVSFFMWFSSCVIEKSNRNPAISDVSLSHLCISVLSSVSSSLSAVHFLNLSLQSFQLYFHTVWVYYHCNMNCSHVCY